MAQRLSVYFTRSSVLASMLLLLLGSGGAVFAVTSTQASHTECSDGLDNDHDGHEDYPEDDECDSLEDTLEGAHGGSATFVSVTDGKESVTAGSALMYVITLRQQRQTTRDIDVAFHLPAQAGLADASHGGSNVNGTIRWDNVSVNADGTTKLTVLVNLRHNIPEGTLLLARVTADGETDTDTTTIRGNTTAGNSLAKEFTVDLNDGESEAKPGDELRYTLRVRNTSDTFNETDVTVFLPALVGVEDVSHHGEVTSQKILWPDVPFERNEERIFTFTVNTIDRITTDYTIHMRARAGTVSDIDDTLLFRGNLQGALSVSLTDNATTVRRGDTLSYVITVRNNSRQDVTNGQVSASLPIYGDFVDALEGGKWDGNNIRWKGLHMPVGAVRTLHFSVGVRGDAPSGHELLASAWADGDKAYDATTVGAVSRRVNDVSDNGPVYDGHVNTPVRTDRDDDYRTPVYRTPVRHDDDVVVRDDDGKGDNVFFSKTASQSETVPGGRIVYTLTVRNTLNHTVSGLHVSDRFDSTLLSIVNQGGGRYVNAGGLAWDVPALRPGETWQVRYTLLVSKSAPQGMTLHNIATISGDEIRDLSLSRRVTVHSSGVIRTLPKTGGANDALFVLAALPMGLGGLLLQRRFKA
jgi:uncharacterized repeat protein (TIGR01451 family)/LPXTG-motif cell wall-anchored protein